MELLILARPQLIAKTTLWKIGRLHNVCITLSRVRSWYVLIQTFVERPTQVPTRTFFCAANVPGTFRVQLFRSERTGELEANVLCTNPVSAGRK